MTDTPDVWEDIETALRHTPRLLLWGPPSTGKTFAAINYATDDRDVIEWTATEGDTKETFFGGLKMEAGDSMFADGIGTHAWKNGSRLVLNEFDKLTYAPEMGAEGSLYALADDPENARTRLDNYAHELIAPAAGFQLVATMNANPRILPEAIRSRFPVTIEVDQVNPAALNCLPEQVRTLAASTILAPEEQRIYLRQWIELFRLRDKERIPLETAARLTLGPIRARDLSDALELA